MRTLVKYRKSLGLSQTELGKRIGVTQATVSDIENGKHFPSVPLLKRISEATGLSLDELLSGETHAA